MTKERMFPILGDDQITAIPWAVIEPHEPQAGRNHSQTLRGLAGRGGLSPCEAVAVMLDRPWVRVHQAWARSKLMSMVWAFEREQIRNAAATSVLPSPSEEGKK